MVGDGGICFLSALKTKRKCQMVGSILLLMAGCAGSSFVTPLPERSRSAMPLIPIASGGTEVLTPPAPAREFRGLWVASIGNRDWPSRPGLSTSQQQKELLAILDRCVQLRLNAVLLQVRPSCDALYDSQFEPWSELLSGTMGVPPSPYYDPLTFAVAAAHARGLELHAWVNPFRARLATLPPATAPSHVTHAHPELIRNAGGYLMLDPSDPRARDYTTRVILDIVHRYDIDGLHLDDYFYPYPEKGYNPANFPDDALWQSYVRGGGKLSRGDWRREGINNFVQQLYASIKKEKPWVKFGISPFGIWRPGHPASVTASLDSYEVLFADSQKWFARGWVDYLSPQLYWPTSDKDHGFAALLSWWGEQNAEHRHLWPGLRAGVWDTAALVLAQEITAEIELTRILAGASGDVLFRAGFVMGNTNGVATTLARVYSAPALIPASPWLGGQTPAKPVLTVRPGAGGLMVEWSSTPGASAAQWLLQVKTGENWATEVLSSAQTTRWFPTGPTLPHGLALSAVSRTGILSPPAQVLLTPAEKSVK
jgi:uncharacterized lipoprotein YddW (UPF0748 family)